MEKIFPFILNKECKYFDFNDCNFKV